MAAVLSTGSVSAVRLTFLEGIRRQVDYWTVVYQRTWRGTVISSFLAPLFYVVAMGVLLGGFIDADPAQLEGATSYFDFVVPGLIAAHAMQTAVGETTYPVMGMIKWQRIYDSMLATPLVCRDLVAAHLGFVLFRLATTAGVFLAEEPAAVPGRGRADGRGDELARRAAAAAEGRLGVAQSIRGCACHGGVPLRGLRSVAHRRGSTSRRDDRLPDGNRTPGGRSGPSAD